LIYDAFDQFANIVAEFPDIAKKSHFVFVPGPMDPSISNFLPRPPIPKAYTQRVHQKIKNAHFTGNPCRIKYCNQEIVIFREDLMNVMRRNAICPLSSQYETSIEQHVNILIFNYNSLFRLFLIKLTYFHCLFISNQCYGNIAKRFRYIRNQHW
jgi:DNA polymerase epsilon subunit 2